MSYIPVNGMSYGDTANMDAFGNLRTVTPTQLFGLSQEYTYHPLVWDHYTASGGTATHSTSTNSTILSTAGSTSGARALRQTKVYHRYSPGKSQLVKLTGTLRKGAVPSGAAFAGVGYYDDDNGAFFCDDSGGVCVVVRSNTSGAPVGDKTYQSAWNVDPMDGTGPSGVTIDWTKEQIFVIDLQWLGVGRVRFGLAINGILYYVHYSNHANVTTAVYARTANLPVRYEAFNSGGAGANVSVEAICSSIDSEGGVAEGAHYPFAYSVYGNTGFTLDTTLRPVITRRLRDTFNGLTVRGHAHLLSFDMLAASSAVYWEIRYNQTVTIGGGGTSTTTDVDTTYSISEYDSYTGAANTVSGGVLLHNGWIPSGGGGIRNVGTAEFGESLLILGRTYAGVRDSYTLSARSLTGSATVYPSIQLVEQY